MKKYFDGIRKKGNHRRWNRGTVLILLLIAGAASVPLMTEYLLEGSGLQASLSKIEAVKQGIGAAFPIRTGTWSSADYGYAAASFQADVFYLIPALLRLTGMGVGTAYKLTLLSVNVAVAVTAFGCFAKCFKRHETALAGSMLFTWCPWRLSEMYVNGNLGDIIAWVFLPVVISALIRLYADNPEGESCGRLWAPLTLGFSLLAVSSTSVLFVTLGMSFLIFLLMGKRSLRKEILLAAGKTAAAVMLMNAWFLIPMLLRLRNAENVGVLIPRDFRSLGMYPAQYLSIFLWGGDSTSFFENGMTGAAALCPGAAAVLLALLCVWRLYAGEYKGADEKKRLVKALAGAGLVLIWLSSSLFPYDMMQDRNMLFSILLSFLQTPVKWGIAACAVIIVIACLTLEDAFLKGTGEGYMPAVYAVGAVSFGTAQFLLGNILKTRAYMTADGLPELLPIQVLTQESAVWRCSEVISAVALCVCVGMSIMRRGKSVKRS